MHLTYRTYVPIIEIMEPRRQPDAILPEHVRASPVTLRTVNKLSTDVDVTWIEIVERTALRHSERMIGTL